MPKKSYFFIIVLLIIVGALVLVYFLNQIKEKEEICQTLPEEEGPSVITPEEAGAGEIGEVMVKDEETGEEKALVSSTMPPAIFSTSGEIIEVSSDGLVVAGDGYNFADQTPRNLTLIFFDETLTFTKDQLKYYKGKQGLNYLEKGIKIVVSSTENIRGKTEFKAKTINIL